MADAKTNGHASEAAVSQDSLTIPLIDFSAFLNSTDTTTRTQTATEILNGFRTAGFIYLRNHSIPSATVQRMFSLSSAFFKLPQVRKDSIAFYSAKANRGYTGMGVEKVTNAGSKDAIEAERVDAPDIKESLEIGREGEEGCPNLWPERDWEGETDWAAFKDEVMQFHATCKVLHMQVMRAIAVALGIAESWFDPFTAVGDNTLRLLHYPPVRKDVFTRNKNAVRAGAHTDYGSITLLFQDERGGLQIQSPKGTFVDATPIEDTIVVNAGDLLARWSNDVVRSTMHRVVEPPVHKDGEEHPARYSIAYFCDPDHDRWIETIPGTLGEGNPKKYEGVNSGEYIMNRVAETY